MSLAPYTPRSLEDTHSRDSLADARARAGDGDLTLSRWIAGMLVRWRLVGLVTLLTIALAVLAIVFLPPVYLAQASFVTNSSSSSRPSGAAAALGGGGLAGVAAQLGISPNADPSESPIFYSSLLAQRGLLTRLLTARFPDPRTPILTDSARLVDLLRIKGDDSVRTMEKAVRQMQDQISSRYDLKTNMVTVTVSAEWPELAAQVANRVVGLVDHMNLEQRQSRGRAKRVFLERRLRESRGELAGAETQLRQFYDDNRQFANSPSLKSREGELRRFVDIKTDLYLTLQREFESAQLGEINDAALLTPIDSAIAPRKPEWPRVGLTLASGTMIGILLGLIAAGMATLVAEWASREPASAAQLRDAADSAWGGLRSIARGKRPRES